MKYKIVGFTIKESMQKGKKLRLSGALTRNNLCAVFCRFNVFRRTIDASHFVVPLRIQTNICPVLGLPVFKESPLEEAFQCSRCNGLRKMLSLDL